MQDHPLECLHPSPAGPCFPGDSRKPWTMRHQPCSSHSGSWLVYTRWKLEDLPISPLRINPFYFFFLVSSLPEHLQALDCDSCTHSTRTGIVATKTLLFHMYYSCAGTVVGSCTHNHTTYSVCSHDSQYICFNAIYRPWEQQLEVWSFTSTGELISQTQVYNPKRPISIHFDVCIVVAKNSVYWPQGIGNTCGGLAWEKSCMSNDKHMWQEDICSYNDPVEI
jgi:hypothetical protein